MRLFGALLLVFGMLEPVRADVVFPEPTQMTLMRSEVIAVGEFVRAEGTPPFTNAAPPTLLFKVSRAIKGCKVGEKLRIVHWRTSAAPRTSSKGMPYSEEEVRAEAQAWQDKTVEVPAAGTRILLFLAHDGKALIQVPDSGGYGYFVQFVNPDEKLIEQVSGMGGLSVGLVSPDRAQLMEGQPIVIQVAISNQTRDARTFDLHKIELLNVMKDEHLVSMPATLPAGQPGILTLKPGESRTLSWDLTHMFPGQFVAPGSYDAALDLPAAAENGHTLHYQFEIVGNSLEYRCGHASEALVGVATVMASESAGESRRVGLGDVTVYRRERETPESVVWPASSPMPQPSERMLVCTEGEQVVWAEPATPDAIHRLKKALADGPHEQWGAAVEIFQDANFAGRAQDLRPGRFDLDQLGIGNDQLSSLRIPPGWKVTLFEHAGFQGRTLVLTEDTAYVGDDFNDITSSIVVEKQPGPMPASAE